ncbi:MAG: alpha/beta hydrolase, partial [Burkholderiales bacterium]
DLGAEVYTFLPVRLLSRYKYETLSTLPRVEAPVLIAHSRGDEIVPFSHAEKLFAAARGPKQLLELHGGHNDGFVFMRPEWVNALGAFLERTTGKTVEPSAADGRR